MLAKRLFSDISKCNDRCIAESGDIDPWQIAALIEASLATAQDRHSVMLALAEFIGLTLQGTPPSL